MDKEYFIVFGLKMDCGKGIEFLRKYLKMNRDKSNTLYSILDFNEYKQTPVKTNGPNCLELIDDYEDWRIKEWGSYEIPEWDFVNISIEDFHCECCPVLPTYEVSISKKEIREKHSDWYYDGVGYREHCYHEFVRKDPVDYYNEFLDKVDKERQIDEEEICLMGIEKNASGYTYCKITVGFHSDTIPMNVLRYWYDNYEIGDNCVKYVSSYAVGEIIFDENGFTTKEIDNEENEDFYVELIRLGCLNEDNVFYEVAEKIDEIVSDASSLSMQHILPVRNDEMIEVYVNAMEKMKSDPRKLAKFIIHVRKQYEEFKGRRNI